MRRVAALLALIAAPASAEVVSASDTGFEVKSTVPLVIPPEAAFAAFGELPAWWNPEHSYSGDASNIRLEVAPGGCFCERIPKSGGGIEHMRVVYVEPGKRVVLTGSLGPLLYEATSGVMDVQVKRVAGGSQLTLDYKVAGFANGGAAKIAPQVDAVLTEQLKRLRTYIAKKPRG